MDSELEVILAGRTSLERLALRGCEGLTEGLFPRWCCRGERHDEAEVVKQLDQVLLTSFQFGHGKAASVAGVGVEELAPIAKPKVARPRRRQHPRCPAAQALRSVTSLSLAGVEALSDRAADALAELLHDAQVVELRGAPQLTEEASRSFRKGCRFLRSVCIVTRDRTISWTPATSGAVKKHRTSCFYTSGSSGTESN